MQMFALKLFSTLLTLLIFLSAPPKPMFKTCKNDFLVLSVVSSPEPSVLQTNLNSDKATLSSS